ncbi:A24 family peptidase [Streptomyces pharetrae]|uniref:A24 family peptidase n=1 Tax=Streptomyces pharetrae TaxID=291370 RepID=UPI0033568AED
MSAPLLIAAAVLWGAAAGAVLPRAAYRLAVPHGDAGAVSGDDTVEEQAPGPRKECPGGHPISGPLRGWLGPARCGACDGGGSYGPSALALASVTALLCAALAVATGPRPELAVWLLVVPVGVLLAVIDVRVRRLPDVLTLPLAGAVPGLLGLAALAPGHVGSWTTALLGSLALGGGYLLLFLINPSGMGFGDVKLALGMGAALGWYGWPAVLLGTFAAFVLGALYGGALVVVRRAGRGTAIAFGPFLLVGTLIGVLSGAGAA